MLPAAAALAAQQAAWPKSGGILPVRPCAGHGVSVYPGVYRPSVAHVLEARQKVDAEEDDEGEPEH